MAALHMRDSFVILARRGVARFSALTAANDVMNAANECIDRY